MNEEAKRLLEVSKRVFWQLTENNCVTTGTILEFRDAIASAEKSQAK